MPNHRSQSILKQGRFGGFTLIEMLVAIVIGAMLLGYGVPSWRDFVSNQRLQAAQSSLTASLAQARGHAIKKHVYVVICPGNAAGCTGGTDWHRGWVAFEDNNRNRRKDTDELLIAQESALGNGIRIRSSSQRRILRFTSLGFSPGSNASLWLCDERGQAHGRSIIVANSGRIRQQNHTSRCH